MTTQIESYVGKMPSPNTLAFFEWEGRVEAWFREQCPVTRARQYHFSTSGSDSGTGSQTSPFLSQTKAQALLDAWQGEAEGLQLLLPNNGVWTLSSPLVVSTSNVTISSWGAHASGQRKLPLLNSFQYSINAGAAWALAAGSRYTLVGLTAVHTLREQGRRTKRVYRKVTSTGLVEANAFSHYYDGTTLHVNFGGANPNTIAWEYTKTTDSFTDVRGAITFLDGADNGRVDGIATAGYGMNGNLNQCWGIMTQARGAFLATNYECFYNPRHHAGLYRIGALATGGLCMFAHGRLGALQETDGASMVFYSGNGGQEGLAVGNHFVEGVIPVDGRTKVAQGSAFVSHTDGGSFKSSLILVKDTSVGGGSYPPATVSDHLHPTTAASLAAVRHVEIGSTLLSALGSGEKQPVAPDNVAQINCFWDVKPVDYSIAAMVGDDPTGWAINCAWRVDLANYTAFAQFGMYNGPSGVAANRSPKFIHCEVRVLSDAAHSFLMDTDNGLTGATVATLSEFVNGSFIVERASTADTSIIDPGLANTATTLRSLAVFDASWGTADYQFSNAANLVVLDRLPTLLSKIPEELGALAGAGEATGLEFDYYLQPRSLTAPTIGPVEAVAYQDASDEGTTPVSPITVRPSRTWRPSPFDAAKAENIVTVAQGFAGTLAAEMDTNEFGDIDDVEGVAISGADDVDVSAMRKTGDGKTVHFNVPTLTETGNYDVVVTVSTLDDQEFSMYCKLVVE